MNDKANFDILFKEYENLSTMLQEEISLEKSVDLYKKSREIYEKLNNILETSKLEVEKIK